MRVDPQSGIREEAAFFGPPGRRLLTIAHLPPGPPRGGVLICSPTQAELMKNYRKEVLLARALAERGFATQRFQYRGTGNSEGANEDVTFHSMLEDTQAVAEWFLQRLAGRPTALVATRLGAVVAAAAAAAWPGIPLALWEPITDTSRYFREAFRFRLMYELGQGGEDPHPSTEKLLRQLMTSGLVDVVGFAIYKPLYESMLGLTLLEALGEVPRPLLFVQVGRGSQLRGEYASLGDRLRAAGFAIEHALVEGDAAWWFDNAEGDLARQDLIGTTCDWLERRLSSPKLEEVM
ncbi:MAG: alpha/beta hydrolase [Actinomycetota bacterium]|nr:alpha/beta hydrolase [Actinomycetota bacterium]